MSGSTVPAQAAGAMIEYRRLASIDFGLAETLVLLRAWRYAKVEACRRG